MVIIELTKANFDEEVLEYKGVVLIDFWASWCAPCNMLSPVIDQVASEHNEIKVVKVNVDEQGELAGKFGIHSIPTLVVMKDGVEVKRTSGLMSKSEVEALFSGI